MVAWDVQELIAAGSRASDIRQFFVYYAEFSGLLSVAYDYFLFRFGAFSKYSPVLLHLSPATKILNEDCD